MFVRYFNCSTSSRLETGPASQGSMSMVAGDQARSPSRDSAGGGRRVPGAGSGGDTRLHVLRVGGIPVNQQVSRV